MQKKKSLGQHFLHSQSFLQAIVHAAEIKAGERVLEVGPGDGALTEELLAAGAKVVAIEKDTRLIPVLRERFAGQTLTVIEGDALEFNTEGALLSYKVVGNIPYYITGALLRKFLSAEHQPSLLVFLIQKEVAERIARSKKESILSLSIKAYGEPVFIKKVPRGAFAPPPKVDSALLAVRDISRHNFRSKAQEKRFFDLLHAGFGSKRKLLKRNLEPLLGKNYTSIFMKEEIPEQARAEDVHLEKWLSLANY
jgi:16S rRNA (adenine1518-N6/adenine1519-N6)-dimethyltransferase